MNPEIPDNLKPDTRQDTVLLATKVYELGLKAVITGDTDPALKRELAAMRQRLNKEPK